MMPSRIFPSTYHTGLIPVGYNDADKYDTVHTEDFDYTVIQLFVLYFFYNWVNKSKKN